MDPSIIFCNYQDSFSRGNTPVVLHTYTNPGDHKSVIKNPVIMNIIPVTRVQNDIPSRDHLKNNNKNYDPFKNVSYKPFVNRDAVTLANLDMVFYLSKHENGYMVKQTDNELSFVSLDNIGFSQYLLYKNVRAVGYGTINNNNNNNNKTCTQISNILDPFRFNVLDIKELHPKYKNVVRSMKLARPEGVDLVLSVFNIETLITALSIVKPGGKFVSIIGEIDGPINNLVNDLLYITSLCFDKITLFKPLSTDINDGTYFVVAEGAKLNNTEWITYLTGLTNTNTNNIYSLLSGRPKTFDDWVTEYNNLILMYKEHINEYPNVELYDTYKCKAIWNLPSI